MNILVTGAAGFIGAAVCEQLLARDARVFAVDNLSDYYDVALKQARLKLLRAHDNFEFLQMDIADRAAFAPLTKHKFYAVIHLAAQAGVRYSLQNPASYVDANLVGFGNILEFCRQAKTAHLLYASSSSVYGANTKLPYAEDDPVNCPVSLYAATKRANEMLARAYAHLYQLRCTGLRFFTVYGPWGRPDMAFFKFAELMLAGQPIPLYNHGNLTRDFTYIDDIVDGVLRVLDSAAPAEATPHRIYNLGRGVAVALMDAVRELENALGITAQYEMLPMQAGDVVATHADIRAMQTDFGFQPTTSLSAGLAAFAEWYRAYYQIPQ